MNLEKIHKQIKNNFEEPVALYGSMICFKLGDVNFEIRSCDDIIAYNDDNTDYTSQLKTIIEENAEKIDLPSCAIKILMSDLNDDNGFIDEESEKKEECNIEKKINIHDFYTKMGSIVKKDREIEIDSFGENHKSFLEFCKKYDETFCALHLGIKRPMGVNLKIARGTNPVIQECVENASGYQFLIYKIVKNIEHNNHKKVGIYCRSGHHRAVAIIELLKKHVYPNAKIKHLHISN